MKAKNDAQVVKNTPVLLIFSALCALFGSGAIVGVTILSNPTLGWMLFSGLLSSYIVCFIVLFLLVLGYGSILPELAYVSLPVAVLACGVRTTFASARFVNSLAIALVFLCLGAAATVCCLWAWRKYPTPQKKPKKPLATLPAILAMLAMGAAVALSLGLFALIFHGRLDSLQTDKTAAGIGQMLYYMQNSAQPFTTLLTGEPQSYFATQFSPLWYLLLPVYVLSKHSLLAVGIALYALMLSAIIPLWRICRKLSLSPLPSAALCIALVTCPLLFGGGSAGGTLSMLSLPLFLWLADALLGKRPYLALIPLCLGLCISFEVALWLVFFCLYLAMSIPRQNRRAGVICTAVSAIGAIATGIWLALMHSPVLTDLFSGIGWQIGQKLLFLFLLLAPCALLPLFCKQKWAIVLLIPYVLFHLVADASTFSGVFCTFAYPAIATVFLLSAHGAANLQATIKGVSLRTALPACALCASLLLATPYMAVLHQLYAAPEEQQASDTDHMHDLLARLPQNASVTASESLLCALHDRTWLYALEDDPTDPGTNVIVLDLREDFIPSGMESYNVAYYQKLGYTLRDDLSQKGLLAVLYK